MVTVYWSVLVQVLALLALLHLLTPSSYYFLIPIFALFIFLNPLYIATPFAIVSPRLREERASLGKKVFAENNPPGEGVMRTYLDHQAREAQTHAFIRSMPTFPIRTRELAFAIVTYGVPLVALATHI
jgi:hypothetical protein